MEPEVRCVAGFVSPSTGIIDSHALMLALQGDAENHGASVVFFSPVESGEVHGGGIILACRRHRADDARREHGRELGRVVRRRMCARSINGVPTRKHPAAVLRQGALLHAVGRAPFHRLVYPVATACVPRRARHCSTSAARLASARTLRGWTAWTTRFDHSREPLFYRGYSGTTTPGLQATARCSLATPASGPRSPGPKEPAADFVIQGPPDHGVAGLVNSLRHRIAGAHRLDGDRGARRVTSCGPASALIAPPALA